MVAGLSGVSSTDDSEPMPNAPVPSPAQEVGNAVSMLLVPIALAAYMCAQGIYERHAISVLAIACAHAPVSATYHFRCALRVDKERLGNFWHRSDQTMNHMVCLVLAVCLSYPIAYGTYAACCAVFNLVFIARLWRPVPGASSGLKVQMPLGIASLLYLIPISWITGWTQFGIALANWLAIGVSFVLWPVIGGYSHMLSHLLFIPLAIQIAEVATKVA